MKTFVAFVIGVACGLVAMFHFSGRLSVLPDMQNDLGQTLHAATMQEAPIAGASSIPAVLLSPPAAATAMVPVGTAAAASVTSPAAAAVEVAQLPPSAVSGLLIPVVGISSGALTDTFTQARGEGRVHDAIDIMAPRGTPVVAANDGHVVKLFTSKPGGLTVYEFDPADKVIYYYAHLDGYASGLAEGQILHRGDPIGFVGSTGNASADAPHLHFEIQILGPEKQWWHATSINPYGRFDGQQPGAGASATLP